MIGIAERQEQALTMLHDSIAAAVAFFEQVDPSPESTPATLAAIAFWLCEHITVAEALASGSKPVLKNGTLAELNQAACQTLSQKPFDVLVQDLPAQGARLQALLQRLPDWQAAYPIRQGGLACTVEDRVIGLAVSIHSQVAALRRAALLNQLHAESPATTDPNRSLS